MNFGTIGTISVTNQNSISCQSSTACTLQITVPATDIGSANFTSLPSAVAVSLTGMASGGSETTNAESLTVNPNPAITTLMPSSVVAGSGSFTLTINGRGFGIGSTIGWNTSTLTPTSVSPTQVAVTIPASDVMSAGSAAVTVINPSPSESSSSVTFNITPPPPAQVSRYLLDLSINGIAVDAIVPSTGQLRALNQYSLGENGLYDFSLFMNPKLPVVYMVTSPNGFGLQINALSISASGVLSLAGSSATDNSASGGSLDAVDPLGRFFYATDFSGDLIVYPLDPTTGVPGTVSIAASGLPTPLDAITIDPTGTYLFVQEGTGSGDIGSYQINSSTGALTQANSPVASATELGDLRMTPSGAFLYGIDSSAHAIYAFSNSAGVLTQLTDSPFSAPTAGSPEHIAIDATGSYLYLTEQSTDGVYGYTIGSDGSLTAMQSGASFAKGSSPNLINADATGQNIFVNNRSGQQTWVYTIGSGGLLTETSKIRTQLVSGQAVSSGSAGLTFTPTALYVTNSSLGAGGTIEELNIDSATGGLTLMNNSNAGVIGAGVAPKTVATDPFQQYAYTPSSSDVYTFNVLTPPNGLSYLGSDFYGSGNGSSWLTTDLSGSFLYVTEQTDNDIWKYSLALGVPTNGASAIGTNAGPVFITVDPSNQFLFTANNASPIGVESFAIGTSQGSLNLVGSVATGVSQRWLAVDPSGSFLYSADPTGGAVWEFTISSTGSIALNTVNPYALVGPSAESQANSIVIEPSGKYLYAVNATLGQIFAYTIDPSTGELIDDHDPNNMDSEVGDVTGVMPEALAVDISGQYLYCVNFGTNGAGSIDVFNIDLSTGFLTYITTLPNLNAPGGLTTTGTVQ